MKIAYIARISSDNRGVLKKIIGQIEYWQRMGNDVKTFFISSKGTTYPQTYTLWKHCNLINPTLSLLRDVQIYHPDCIYMREDTLPISRFLRFLFWCKKIILEINSNYDTEGKLDYSSFRAKRNFWINYAVNHFFYSRIAGIVSVSHEILQLPHFSSCRHKIVIPNTINIKNIKTQKTFSSMRPINLLFLGSPHHPWHGLDKIIHLAKKLGNSFQVHLVGPSQEDISKFNPPSNIIAYGYRTEYASILQKCHIALGTLALHRKNMNEASPLKVREYLASGFPTIIAYEDSAFIGLPQPPDFILKIDNSETCFNSPESIERVRTFCIANCTRVLSHKEIEIFIDSDPFEKKRLTFMRDCLQ